MYIYSNEIVATSTDSLMYDCAKVNIYLSQRPPLDPPTRLREKIVSPMEKGAKPVLDCGLEAYNVRPLESEIVLKDMLSYFWFSASSNATVNAV